MFANISLASREDTNHDQDQLKAEVSNIWKSNYL